MKTFVMIGMFFCCSANAQVTTHAEQQMEKLAEREEAAIDGEEWTERVQNLLQNPVPVNTATEEELHQLDFLLHPIQVHQLLQYRRLLGPLIHVYELQAIPGWEPETVKSVLPYITLRPPQKNSIATMLRQGEQQLRVRMQIILQQATGFERTSGNRYLGSRPLFTAQYRKQFKNSLYLGWIGDKDAGETFFRRPTPGGFDFHSFHFLVRRPRLLRTVALGDYTLNIGQGLMHWQATAFKKGSDVLSVMRQSELILPYRSAGAFYFNRGAALSLHRKGISGTLFYSQKKVDANTDTDLIRKEVFFTSFSTSGLHRTLTEIKNQKTVRHLLYGVSIAYRWGQTKIGMHSIHHHFSLPRRSNGAPYQLLAIQGRGWWNTGTDYSTTFRNLHFFGEVARAGNGSMAWLHGLLISLHKVADLSLLYRHISSRYHSVSGNAFTEQSLPSNERGIYTGLRLRPGSRWQVDAFQDLYHFPWLRFRTDAPSHGQDYLLQVSYRPNRRTLLYARYRSEQKGNNVTNPYVAFPQVISIKKTGLRVHAEWEPAPHFQMKARMENIWYDRIGSAAEEGFLWYVEGAYDFPFSASCTMRIQYFETGGFNSRVYAYESDVAGGFSIPALYDNGWRLYAHLKSHLTKRISFHARFAQTVYRNRAATGTGLSLIQGNKVSEVTFQASYRF